MVSFFKKTLDRPKRDRIATEKALLQSAKRLFAEKGYENTRTLEIAKDAGVNEALIARYFGGKEGLLDAILKDPRFEDGFMNEECFSSQQFKLLPRNFGDALVAFFGTHCKTVKKGEGFMRIASARALLDEGVAESMRKNIMERRLLELETGLKDLTSKARLSDEELKALMMLIGSTGHSLNFWGRQVFKVSGKKVDLSLQIFAEALELYLRNRS